MTLLKFIRKLTFCGEPKTKRNISDVKVHSHTFRIFRKILDNIKIEISDRYNEIKKLRFFRLLDSDNFFEFKNNFSITFFVELKT